MLRRIIFLIAIFTSLFFIVTAHTFGESSIDPAVDKVNIINNSDSVQVSFEVKNAFTKDIEDGIKSGIPTTFTFFIEISQKQDLWVDETLAEMTFRHTIKYDTLKEEYEIVQGEKQQSTLRVKDIEQAKKIMARGDNIIIKPVLALVKEKGYQLRIKATLDPVNLPFPLNYMLFFVSFWNYETSWYAKEFVIK